MSAFMKFFAGLLALVIIVPLLAAGYFVATFDEKAFRTQAMKQVSAALGREVVVEGPIGLDVHDGIALSLKQVSIGNPQGFSEQTFAKVGTLFVSVNWQALLVRKVDVRKITLADASVSLIANANGQNNWTFPMGANKQPVAAPTGKPEANMIDEVKKAAAEGRAPDFSINSVALNNVEITNADIKQIDLGSGKKQEFVISHALLKVPASGSFHADGKGLVNGASMEMRIDTQKSLREVKEGEPLPLDMHLAYNGQDYDLKGQFVFKGKTYRFEKMEAKLFGATFDGNLQADMSGSVPSLSGSISTPELNLTKMPPAAKAENGRLLATPVAASTPSLAVLRSFNSNIEFTTARLVASPTLTIENVNTRIKVAGGVLTLDPLNMTYEGVPWAGLVAADASANIRVAMHATNVDYTKLAQSFGTKSPVDSKGDITFDLSGQGLDADAFVSTLTGKIEITSGSGNVDWNGGNGLGGAMMKTLVPASATEKPKLTCADVRFNATNGVLRSNGLLLDSNYATVGGDGTVNLKNKNVDIVLKPVPKGSTTVTSLTSAVPVRVSGPLTGLSFMPQADAVLQKAVGGLLSPGQKINTGVPRVDASASGNPCVSALNNPQPIMLDPPNSQQIIKDVKGQAVDTYKNIRDAVKDPSKGLGNLLGGSQQQPATGTAPAAAPANNGQKAMDVLKGLLGK